MVGRIVRGNGRVAGSGVRGEKSAFSMAWPRSWEGGEAREGKSDLRTCARAKGEGSDPGPLTASETFCRKVSGSTLPSLPTLPFRGPFRCSFNALRSAFGPVSTLPYFSISSLPSHSEREGKQHLGEEREGGTKYRKSEVQR